MGKLEIILSNGKSLRKNLSNKVARDLELGKNLLDIKAIADAIFLTEDAIHARKQIKEVKISLHNEYSNDLSEHITQLLEFLFNKSIKVSFTAEGVQSQIKYGSDYIKNGYTCLFSGGLDSFSGILNSKNHFGHVEGAFTNHADLKSTIGFIRKLERLVLSKHGIRVTIIPSEKNNDYTRVSRGALYVLNSLLLKNSNVIVSEVGPTMYQPKFTVLDDITFTTHPQVMELSKKIAGEVLNTRVKIIEPYEDLTKAEAAAISPEKKYLGLTCSCRTVRWCNSKKPNGDSCYGCIIRRLAFLVAGIKDSGYRRDVLTLGNNDKEQYDNALHLLRFNLDVLKDFDDIPEYTKSIISSYNKEDLFRRFSLDTYAGLYLLDKSGKLPDKNFRWFLDNALQVVSKDDLTERIAHVRSKKFKLDYNHSY
jgi:hypothetical protein